MSNYDINSNPALVRLMIENAKKATKKRREEYPDSLIPHFEKELRELGFEFEISNQILCFMPKHKETIWPIAIKYYKAAKYDNEKAYFIGFFLHKGFEEVVPMLLADFYSLDTPRLVRERITDALWKIRSKKYIEDYLKIISNPEYKTSRVFITLLVSELKVEEAIPFIVNMLDDTELGGIAVRALGNYKREEFRLYFERFETHKNSGWRKYAKAALTKLEK